MKKHLNIKNNSIVTTAKVFSLATILLVAAIGVSTMSPLTALGSRFGEEGEETGFINPVADRKAPSVVS